MQVRYLNRALSRFDSTQVIPTQFVMFTISVILGSAVLYRDFESADAERVGKFIGACALTFLGVYLITSGRASENGENMNGQGEDEEEGIGLIDEESQYHEEQVESDIVRTDSHEVSDGRTDSRSNSVQPDSRPAMLERLGSSISQPARPFTPPSYENGSTYDENPWADGSRENTQPQRLSSYQTASSVATGISETPSKFGMTQGRREHLTVTPDSRARHRRSIADIFPGPISTPLSGSLSGIVADRRREFESTPSKFRRSLGFGRSRSSRPQQLPFEDSPNGNPPSFPIPAIDLPDSEDTRKRRSRSASLGDTLSSIFTRSPKKKSNDDEPNNQSNSQSESGET
jgi:magnesium transporter